MCLWDTITLAACTCLQLFQMHTAVLRCGCGKSFFVAFWREGVYQVTDRWPLIWVELPALLHDFISTEDVISSMCFCYHDQHRWEYWHHPRSTTECAQKPYTCHNICLCWDTVRVLYLHVFRAARRKRWSVAILQKLNEMLPGLYLHVRVRGMTYSIGKIFEHPKRN